MKALCVDVEISFKVLTYAVYGDVIHSLDEDFKIRRIVGWFATPHPSNR